MTLRFLNCASMAPPFPRWQAGGTCILVDTDAGPVLVDTGLGLHDFEAPTRRVRFLNAVLGVQHTPESIALHQLARLGIAARDVRHVVMTHLHFDHAGGLPDFPDAQVHLHIQELEALRHPQTWRELPYDRADFAHGPNWVPYDQIDRTWFGWDAIALPFTPEMVLVPLFGHSRGHCGVAIRTGDGWLFHCGDALPLNVQFDRTPPWLDRMFLGPHEPRLQALAAAHPEIRLCAGHMDRAFYQNEAQA